jgi:hypothetical protein
MPPQQENASPLSPPCWSRVLTPSVQYWDSDWFRKACKDVTADDSLENKVDQLWQTILTPLFPFHDGYMLFCHDRVTDSRRFAADVMVKRQEGADAKAPIIFMPSNKRNSLVNTEHSWDEALGQLLKYLKLERENHRDDEMVFPQHGAVAIGTLVRFYEYHGAGGSGTKPGTELVATDKFDVQAGQKLIQERLEAIKAQADGTAWKPMS